MKIGLLSFAVDKTHPEQVRGNESVVLDALESHQDLDLLVAAGWTLFSDRELSRLLSASRDTRAVVMLETWKDSRRRFEHHGHVLRSGELLVSDTPQVFASSAEANRSPEMMSRLMDAIDERRIEVAGRTLTWLICGEINVLANAQSDGNRVRLRHEENDGLASRWQQVFERTDVFVNPTHTVMGNQGKLKKRREYLSAGGRVYCSTSNVDGTGRDAPGVTRRLRGASVQYLFKDGADQPPDDVIFGEGHVLRTFTV